jgi:hypothetical protein
MLRLALVVVGLGFAVIVYETHGSGCEMQRSMGFLDWAAGGRGKMEEFELRYSWLLQRTGLGRSRLIT